MCGSHAEDTTNLCVASSFVDALLAPRPFGQDLATLVVRHLAPLANLFSRPETTDAQLDLTIEPTNVGAGGLSIHVSPDALSGSHGERCASTIRDGAERAMDRLHKQCRRIGRSALKRPSLELALP